MIEVLRKSYVALAVLALALIAQIPHAAYVFDNIASGGDTWTVLGYCYAIALELAVLMFVVHGKQAESYGFALASVLVNLSYYAMQGVSLFSVQALPAWLVAFMLPVAIARYSHVIAEVDDVQVDWSVLQVAWRKLIGASVQDTDEAQVLAVRAPSHDGVLQDAQDAKEDWLSYAMQLRDAGRTLREIASEVGKHESTVSRRLNGVIA